MCVISFLFVTFVPSIKAIRRFVFMEHLMKELRKMETAMENGVVRKNPLRLQTLKKLIGYLLGTDKPKRERLDNLSLLLGFQNWDAFKNALYGTDDGEGNYDSTPQVKTKKQ